ncbi:MAG: hypothetical protein Q9191_003395 [Dirinaria sp. TL-2023a]
MSTIEEVIASSRRLLFLLSDGFLFSPFSSSPRLFQEARLLCRSKAQVAIECLHNLLTKIDTFGRIELSMAQNTKDNLLCHSRYIRDTLAPVVVRENGKLNEQQANSLRTIFAAISSIKMTVELLQYSRIDKAINLIAAEGSIWPVEATLLSDALLSAWERSLGSLKNIRADLWGPGGRLEGIKKLTDAGHGADAGERRGSAWSVEDVKDRYRAYNYGHLGFNVGDWWIKPAAAFRDGIIDASHNSISADAEAAYAIRMGGHDEESEGFYQNKKIDEVERTTIKYTPSVHEPKHGIYRLMETIRSGKAVRVLRSWKLKSSLAPKAGLRYDGLYRVIGHGVRLATNFDGTDRWEYTFHLSRVIQPPQDSMEKALAVPLSDQMDDWKDYQRTKADQELGGLVNMLLLPKSKSEIRIPRDSGYFSPNPSGEASGTEN